MTEPTVTVSDRNVKTRPTQPMQSRISRRSVLVTVACTIFAAAAGYGGIYAVWLHFAPRLSLSTTHLDLGDVPPQQTVTGVVILTNSGKRPVQIGLIQSSCGCTVASLSKNRLAPSEQLALEIDFTASSSSFSTATVTLASNDPINPVQSITIEARRPLQATVSPSAVLFDEGDRNSLPAVQRIQMSFTRSDTLENGNEITAKADCEFLKVRIDKKSRLLTAFAEVTLLESSPTGIVKTSVHLQDLNGYLDEVVPVEVRIGSRYFFPEPALVVCDVSQDREGPSAHEFELRRRPGVDGAVEEVRLDAVLRPVLDADFVESNDKMIVRLTDKKQSTSTANYPAKLEGFIAVTVAGNFAEVYRLPVLWCNPSERRVQANVSIHPVKH